MIPTTYYEIDPANDPAYKQALDILKNAGTRIGVLEQALKDILAIEPQGLDNGRYDYTRAYQDMQSIALKALEEEGE